EAGAPKSYELVDRAKDSRLLVSPDRGAIAWSWRAHGRDLFFLDAETLRDPSKNVRGGNPVLFPSPGKLHGDAWAREGRSGALKQHGFARNLAWRVVETGTNGGARIAMALESSDATREGYPWDFAATLTYTIAGPRFRIDVRVENRSREPLPFGFG